jgi:hypothetical protein
MDDKTAYLDLRLKMEKLLVCINGATGRDYGACFEDNTCTMTLQTDCHGTWLRGVECIEKGDDPDYARESQELVERMGRLLQSVHASSGEVVRPCSFEAGGKTYWLEMTLAECAVVGGDKQ